MSASTVRRYLVPDLPSADDILPYLRRIDVAQWYSNFGPLVREFEQRLQSLLSEEDVHPKSGRIYLSTFVSGYCALEVGLRILGIGRGKRVLMPAITFSACPLAVLHTGAEALLADVDPENWSLTPGIARTIAGRTHVDAVMPVAAYGIPLPAPEWDAFSLSTGIPVLIDAAAALGTQPVPEYGLVACSLHATKPFGVGEGGLLVGRNPDLIETARQYSNFGMINRVSYTDGANAKMSEYHAAVGLAQLDRWNDIKVRRRRLLDLYRDHLAPLDGLASLHPSIAKAVVSCLMVLLRVPVAEAILGNGDPPNVAFHRTYFPPLYRHPHFSSLPVIDVEGMELPPNADEIAKQAHMTNCERLGGCLLGVPFHPFLDETAIATVTSTLRHLLCGLSESCETAN